jgi:hypothetical protein
MKVYQNLKIFMNKKIVVEMHAFKPQRVISTVSLLLS